MSENQLAKKETFSQYLTKDSIKSKINAIVGSEKGASFISGLLSAVQTNPTLQMCTQASLLNCALLGHSLNLSPSPHLGHFYIVPYENKKLGIVFRAGDNKSLVNCMKYVNTHLCEIRANRDYRVNWAANHISGRVVAKYLIDCLLEDTEFINEHII